MNSVVTFRWGILATGKIAHKFAAGLQTLPDAAMTAVGARSVEKARAFADEFGIGRAWGSYEALVADPEVDIIYVATPHNFHYEHTLLALSHGKHVLCEKPLAVNARQAADMAAMAADKGLMLMEAMWTRYLPVWVQVRQWLASGLIGQVRMLMADFCFHGGIYDPLDRKYNPELAGGALLDIGIYPLYLADMVMGEAPVAVVSTASLGQTGVDEQSAYVFQYKNGALAMLSSSFQTNGPKEAVICGDKGLIRVPLFWRGQSAVVELNGQAPEQHDFPFVSSGLQYQAAAMMEALRSGQREEPWMTPAASVALHQQMDALRQTWGLVYPGE